MHNRLYIILLSLCLICGFQANAQQSEPNDTVVIITNAEGVNVTYGPNSIAVDVERTGLGNTYKYKATATQGDSSDADWDINLPFLNTKSNKFQTLIYPRITNGVMNAYETSDGLSKRYSDFASLEFGELCWCLGWDTHFSLGLGMEIDYYRFGCSTEFDYHDDVLHIVNAPAAATDVKSSISHFSWIAPLRFNQNIYRNIGFSIGVIGRWNTYTKAYNNYQIGDTKYKEKINGLHQNRFTFDYTAALRFDCFSITFNYSPCQLFQKGYGPELKRWGIGLSLTIK